MAWLLSVCGCVWGGLGKIDVCMYGRGDIRNRRGGGRIGTKVCVCGGDEMGWDEEGTREGM